jgi:hypothetical protein
MATKLAWLPAAAGAAALAAVLASAPASLRAEPRLFPVLNTDPVETIRDQRARDAMAADELVANLVARGYRDISAPRRKGGYYVVEAIGRRGERITLIVDVWTGEVSGLRRRFD